MKRRGFLKRLAAFLGVGAAVAVAPALVLPDEHDEFVMKMPKSPKFFQGPVVIELVLPDGKRITIGQVPSLEYSKKKFGPVPVIQDWKPTEGQFTLKFDPIDA